MGRKINWEAGKARDKVTRARRETRSAAYTDGFLDGAKTGYSAGYDTGYADGSQGKPHRRDRRAASKG